MPRNTGVKIPRNLRQIPAESCKLTITLRVYKAGKLVVHQTNSSLALARRHDVPAPLLHQAHNPHRALQCFDSRFRDQRLQGAFEAIQARTRNL